MLCLILTLSAELCLFSLIVTGIPSSTRRSANMAMLLGIFSQDFETKTTPKQIVLNVVVVPLSY